MDNRKSLTAALIITTVIFFVELIGGLISNSLALTSDAGHVLTDAMALILALLATIFATRPATKERTFGFYRLEILSSLFNGSFLTIIAIYIFYQAYQRFVNPTEVQSGLMLIIAFIGLLANILAALILSRTSRENLNVRGAFMHVMSDLGASVGVIIGGIIIYFTRLYIVDPILGVLIGVLILKGALDLVYESANILLESAPVGVKVEDVASTIREVKGVKDIHDLHVWAITSGMNSISAHLVINDSETERASEILKEINAGLKTKYKITHSTFQTECASCPEGLICKMEQTEREPHEH
jgi:cobalt-zinc-cadmium efflux system protein